MNITTKYNPGTVLWKIKGSEIEWFTIAYIGIKADGADIITTYFLYWKDRGLSKQWDYYTSTKSLDGWYETLDDAKEVLVNQIMRIKEGRNEQS